MIGISELVRGSVSVGFVLVKVLVIHISEGFILGIYVCVME